VNDDMIEQHLSGTISVRDAIEGDVFPCKAIADRNRDQLGFLVSAAFTDSIRRRQLLVAHREEHVIGFVRFNHHVRGTETALYDICVDASARRQGVGRMLVQMLIVSCRKRERIAIMLRCPEPLPANDFYAHLGFQRIAVEPGRRRRLVVWRLPLGEA
jgi:ribosomal protein S18 acetylase RimI-like enzyme